MGRISRDTYGEIEKQLREGKSVKKVASSLIVGEAVVQKVADALNEEKSYKEVKEDPEAETQLKGSGESELEKWKRRADFWKKKYLETWADLVELGAD